MPTKEASPKEAGPARLYGRHRSSAFETSKAVKAMVAAQDTSELRVYGIERLSRFPVSLRDMAHPYVEPLCHRLFQYFSRKST